MRFYASPEAESLAVRRAAARSGCQVRDIDIRGGTGVAPRVQTKLRCTDGWQAAKLLLALAAEDAQTPGAAALAAAMRAKWPADADFAEGLQKWVQQNIRFVPEVGEIFQSPGWTLQDGAGDCDCQFRLVYAVAVAGGLPAALGILHHGYDAPPEKAGPAHAVALVAVDGRPLWAETTLPAFLGEAPNDAAARLGVKRDRDDIAKEQRIMSEDIDLPPVPAGYKGRHAPSQVYQDAIALQRLGFLRQNAPQSVMVDPTNVEFRSAVWRYQQSQLGKLTIDGLVGPSTEGRLGTIVGSPTAPKLPTFTHAQARAILADSYRALFGRDATAGELDFAAAVAFFESGYGRAGAADWVKLGQFARWASEGRFNWGALEGSMGSSAAKSFQAHGLDVSVDIGADAGRKSPFFLFPNDAQAATALWLTWGQPDTLAAAAAGSAIGVAAAMKRHGYYEGFFVPPGNPGRQPMPPFVEASSAEDAQQRNIAAYAGALQNHRKTVTGPGGVLDPADPNYSRPGIPGAAIAFFVGVGLAVAGAGVVWWRT